MPVSAISGGSLASTQNVQTYQNRLQKFKDDFEQIGQDLQSGNLAGAQAAFDNIPKPGQGQPSSQPGTAIEQAFGQLGQNLQSGNVASAQQDFTQIQKDVQNRFSQLGSTIADTTISSPSSTLSVSA
jgi:hypothetical protein